MKLDESRVNDIDMQEAKKTSLHFAKAFGLEESEDIDIDFERSDNPRNILCEPTIDEREILSFRLRERSLQAGVKLLLARLAGDTDTTERLPLFRGLFIGFLYPTCVLALSLILVFTVLPADPMIAVLAGPIMFTLLALPPELSMALIGRKRLALRLQSITDRLRSTGIYSDDAEIGRYAMMSVRGRTTYYVLVFSMYIVGMFYLLLAVAQ